MPNRCNDNECTKRPSYGVDSGIKVEFCSLPTRAGMVDFRKRRMCARNGCTTQPSFGVDGGRKKAEFGSQHARAAMMDILYKNVLLTKAAQAAIIRRGRWREERRVLLGACQGGNGSNWAGPYIFERQQGSRQQVWRV